MESPNNPNLPFFAYGLFRPGQLGYLRLKPHVRQVESGGTVSGALLDRDGLPLYDPSRSGTVRGALIWFRNGAEGEAYDAIAAIEPAEQYRWDECLAHTADSGERANVLVARRSNKGTVVMEGEWDGREDPLFRHALQVVHETLTQNEKFEWDLKPLFRIEMAYLLLWTAIERYASLRYHLGGDANAKVAHVAHESAFRAALAALPKPPDGVPMQVFRADRPDQRYRLKADKPSEALNFYYQIRSNATHRGKAVAKDFDLVRTAAEQLLDIFKQVLEAAFAEADIDKQ